MSDRKSGHPDPASKVMSLQAAAEWRSGLRTKNMKVVMTNGCFDILHRGHAEYLMNARSMGDVLLLAINSDESVRMLKGPSRPLVGEVDRAFMLGCMTFVDAVVMFNGKRCIDVILALRPDIYVKGGDYTIDTIDADEKAALLSCGTDIRFIPFIKGFSSSSIIGKMNS